MRQFLCVLALVLTIQTRSQDLIWNTSTIADNATSFDFGPIGSPVSSVTYNVTGPGTINAGPARFTTTQGDLTWRTQVTFATIGDVKTYTFTFSNPVCGLNFILYDIDGTNAAGDQATVTADNSGSPQTITMTTLDASPPTITGSGTNTATAIGTQGSQTDDRVQVSITGCVTTLTIEYGNNTAGAAGTNSFSIGNFTWSSTSPFTEDLVWNTSAIPDNSTSFNFGSVGSPASTVTYNVTGPGSFDLGPLRFITSQGTDTWRTRSTFSSVNDLKTYTLTFNPAVCNLSFILYDIDGDNSSGDRALVTADNFGTPQNVTLTALDANPPTITNNGTSNPMATGTQGNQEDDRVHVNISGCVSTLTIQYGNNTAGAAGQRSFSIGNLSWSLSTLPVHFISFTGQKKTNGSVELKWSTENELNIGTYEVERSTDGQNFSKVGNVMPLNRSAQYTFTDFPSSAATVFYRIREVDIDGRSKYSTIVAIKINSAKLDGITVFPNPSTDVIFITTNNGALIDKVQIFDTYGRVVLQKQGAQNKFEVNTLARGIYRVTVTDSHGNISNSSFIRQ